MVPVCREFQKAGDQVRQSRLELNDANPPLATFEMVDVNKLSSLPCQGENK